MINESRKACGKTIFSMSALLILLAISMLVLLSCAAPEREALRGLKGNYLVVTEIVYENALSLSGKDPNLKQSDEIVRVYDEEYRLVKKVTKSRYNSDLKIWWYRYSGNEVFSMSSVSDSETGEYLTDMDTLLSYWPIDFLPLRNTVLFGDLVVWDIDDYPIGVAAYHYENYRYEVVGEEKPHPVTIVYYNGYGYPVRRTKYWSRQYINNHDGLHEEFRYEYDADQRLTKVSEYKDSSWTKDWLLQVVRTFEYQNKTL